MWRWLCAALVLVACQKKDAFSQLADATFICTRDGQSHQMREIGFNLPDSAFSLKLAETERSSLAVLKNEDEVEIAGVKYVRGWAPFKVSGHEGYWGIGFWVSQSPLRIANQALYGAPTLGVAAKLEERSRGLRPVVWLTDEKHPLTALQKSGLTEAQWRAWASAAQHQGEAEPAQAPFTPALETHGWAIRAPGELGKAPVAFAEAPQKGDTVKLAFDVLTADPHGACAAITAGWWVLLDDVSRPDLWSGTLNNYTKVQATIAFGSRVWLRPEQVLQHAPAEAP